MNNLNILLRVPMSKILICASESGFFSFNQIATFG